MSDPSSPAPSAPRRTPLHDLHVELGGRMVDFAGWSLPVHYPAGIIAEHRHCRAAAALFDVSHMGQVLIAGPDAAETFERLVPGDVTGLAEGRLRYTLFTNEQGGVLDDLIVGRVADGLFVVVNAGCRDADLAHMRASARARAAGRGADRARAARAAGAGGGPGAGTPRPARRRPRLHAERRDGGRRAALPGLARGLHRRGRLRDLARRPSRPCRLARRLLEQSEVAPAGLGARDSLRLEAGLCLYGHELTPATSPIEAQLAWTIPKRRRAAGDFPGAAAINAQLERGPARKLVGILPEGRAPAREGTEIRAADGTPVGSVTSGGFGPTVGAPVALGYVASAHAAEDTALQLAIRGRPHPARVARLPFVAHRYQR